MKLSPEDIEEVRFTVVKGSKPGATVPFEGGLRTIRIGRAVDNEIVINDPSVSRLHAQVEIRRDGYFIFDAGSRAGVEKMGFQVGRDPEPLESGDELKLGDTILRFEVVAKKGALRKAEPVPGAPAKAAPAVSPIQGLLHRIGLRSRGMQLFAGGLLVVLLAVVLWPTAPGLPPQVPGRPVPVDYNAVVGYTNVDQSRLDGAIVELSPDGEGLGLYFNLLAPSGVEIRFGNRSIARLDPATRWENYQLVALSRAVAEGGRAKLTFDNLGYSPAEGDVDPRQVKPWGVRRMWVARVLDAASSPAQLLEEMRAMEDLHRRLDDSPSNPYALLGRLRQAALGLMKISGRSAVLIPIPAPDRIPASDVGELLAAARAELDRERPDRGLDHVIAAIARIDGDLNREYRKQLNAVGLARKTKSIVDEARILAYSMRLIPEPTDPRNRVFGTQVRKLRGNARKVYDEALERFGGRT